MLWGGRWEGGSCLGTHVRIKYFKIKKIKKLKKKKKKRKNPVPKESKQFENQEVYPLGISDKQRIQGKLELGVEALLNQARC